MCFPVAHTFIQKGEGIKGPDFLFCPCLTACLQCQAPMQTQHMEPLIHTHTVTHTHMETLIHTHTHTNTLIYRHTHADTYTHTHTHGDTHTHTLIWRHSYTHIHTHTHTDFPHAYCVESLKFKRLHFTTQQ